MNRTTFVIDGFNLYHSCRDIAQYHKINVKWLNIHSFCSSLVRDISASAVLAHIYYYSAYAFHLGDPSVIQRHQKYIQCLKATGVVVEMGRFKEKTITCPRCNSNFLRHEEKETDVAVASKLFELLSKNECDTVVLVTGDTDLIPAVKTAKRLFLNSSIVIAFPFKRKNEDLAKLVPSLTIKPKRYVQHQFPDPFVLPDGTIMNKPSTW